jgi:hypothetical protein
MRSVIKLLLRRGLYGLILLAAVQTASAQSVTVSVGGVPKYSGIITNESDVNDLKDINQFLNVLESQLAAEFVKYSDVDYLDRTNTLEIFREVHLSSGPSFDPSSGAVRGLMGRLDYLVVIDSSEPSTARIRLIDVETGAVKAIESCKRRTSFLGMSSDAPPDCIPLFVTKAHSVTTAKLADKRLQFQQHQQDNQRAQQQAAEQQRQQAQQQKALEKQRQQEQLAAQQKAEQQAKEQAERDSEIADMRPRLDNATSRLNSENSYWTNKQQQLTAAGHSLRSDILTLLNSANSDSNRCQNFLAQQDVNHLQTCTDDLNQHLDSLDAYK